MNRTKKILTVTILMSSFFLTACSDVEKIEKKTNTANEENKNIKVSQMIFETKSISEIRNGSEKSMSVLGTDSSEYGNIGKTGIVPIITDEDEIYNIRLTKSDGNELTKTSSFNDEISSKRITDSYQVYRNDKEKVKTKINIPDGTDIEDLIGFVENYMDTEYSDSLFKWVVEDVIVYTLSDKRDVISVTVRPSYDGVVFTRTLIFDDAIPANARFDFMDGLLNITSMNKIDEYYGISPYYEVERQGDAISEILSIESALSIVANKTDRESVNEIEMFELAYRLNRNMTAVPIWNIVINENDAVRNFQIDAVTGDVYFE
ncbi:MAG: hypothetical protein HDT39_14135 [Lachnospiraceae bacterium]|nr:hypothetical protein [Lachnospiraceae bacterium]